MANTSEVIYLHIRSYQGVSYGAEHYYGKLRGSNRDEEDMEIRRIMSKRVAQKLSKKDDWKHEAGDETYRFDSEQAIIKIALATYKEHFPHAKLLILGYCYYAEPQLILACENQEDKEILDHLYKLAQEQRKKGEVVSMDLCKETGKILRNYDQ